MNVRPFGLATLSAALTLATVPSASSAQGTSVLTLIPTEGRSLEVGSDQTGALSTSDHLSHDDTYLEAWDLSGRAGQTVTVDLESDAFDPRVYLVGPGLAETLFDDDSGGGCNARLTVTFLENGTFRVVASSLSRRETGTYRLRVSERPGPAPSRGCGEVDTDVLNALPSEGRSLRMGSSESSVLTAFSSTVQDGRHAEAWRLEGRAGERVSIVMASDDFDTYLYLTGPGLDELLTDDDGAGNLDSMIEVTLPTSGPFTVVAAGLSADALGAYTIRVEAPVDLGTVPTEGRTIDPGQRIEGRLGPTDRIVQEGRRGQAWAFDGESGQRILIELESADFDTYLYLVGPGLDEPLSDDDSGDDTNSLLSTTLPGTGVYRIIAAAYSDGTGDYSLSVTPR